MSGKVSDRRGQEKTLVRRVTEPKCAGHSVVPIGMTRKGSGVRLPHGPPETGWSDTVKAPQRGAFFHQGPRKVRESFGPDLRRLPVAPPAEAPPAEAIDMLKKRVEVTAMDVVTDRPERMEVGRQFGGRW